MSHPSQESGPRLLVSYISYFTFLISKLSFQTGGEQHGQDHCENGPQTLSACRLGNHECCVGADDDGAAAADDKLYDDDDDDDVDDDDKLYFDKIDIKPEIKTLIDLDLARRQNCRLPIHEFTIREQIREKL